jgi:hypothetical protein
MHGIQDTVRPSANHHWTEEHPHDAQIFQRPQASRAVKVNSEI